MLCQACEELIDYKHSYKCDICDERFCEDCIEDDICLGCQQDMKDAESLPETLILTE
jgi:hypothetical protein